MDLPSSLGAEARLHGQGRVGAPESRLASCRRGAGSCDRMACGRAGASRPRADRRPPVPPRVQGDFFALAASEAGFDPAVPARRFDAVLVDIDHSPDFLLDPQNAAFYGEQGLSRLAAHLRPGGIFALWSNDRLDDAFTAHLRRIFADARAEEVTFHNPLQDKPFTQTVYLAKNRRYPAKLECPKRVDAACTSRKAQPRRTGPPPASLWPPRSSQ